MADKIGAIGSQDDLFSRIKKFMFTNPAEKSHNTAKVLLLRHLMILLKVEMFRDIVMFPSILKHLIHKFLQKAYICNKLILIKRISLLCY